MKGANLLIQGLKLFTGNSASHGNAANESVLVVSVNWLSKFQHHIVGDVNGDRDRTHAGKLETIRHPARYRCICVNPGDSKGCKNRRSWNAVDWSIVLNLDAKSTAGFS